MIEKMGAGGSVPEKLDRAACEAVVGESAFDAALWDQAVDESGFVTREQLMALVAERAAAVDVEVTVPSGNVVAALGAVPLSTTGDALVALAQGVWQTDLTLQSLALAESGSVIGADTALSLVPAAVQAAAAADPLRLLAVASKAEEVPEASPVGILHFESEDEKVLGEPPARLDVWLSPSWTWMDQPKGPHTQYEIVVQYTPPTPPTPPAVDPTISEMKAALKDKGKKCTYFSKDEYMQACKNAKIKFGAAKSKDTAAEKPVTKRYVGHLAEGRIPGKFAIIWDLRVTGDNLAKVPPDARRASEKDLKAAGLELKALNGLVPQITLPSKQQLSCRNTALEGGVFSFGGLSLKKAADSTPGCDENQF